MGAMSMLDEKVRAQVRERFADLSAPVRLVFFERSLDCDTCPEARALAQEVAGLSDRIAFEAHNAVTDRAEAEAFRVGGAAPVLAVVGETDHGVRFLGTPSGYEFGTLIETIRDVSAGRVALEPSTIEALKGLTRPVHLQVFVTPT